MKPFVSQIGRSVSSGWGFVSSVAALVVFGLAAIAGCKDVPRQPDQPPAAIAPVAPVAPQATAADPPVDQPTAVDLERHATYHTGYRPDPQASAQFLRSLPQPEFRQAAPHFFARGPPTIVEAAADDEPVLLYRALQAAHLKKFGRPWVVGAQGIGDCVSWGWGHGITILLAIDYVQGRSGDFQMVSTEAQYGLMRVEAVGRSRGGYSDGCYGAAAAKSARYGVVFKLDYRAIASDECDLTKYSASRAKQWGNFGCGGSADRGRLDGECRRHVVRQVALVTTFDEAAAAIKNGYPVAVCSGQGFSSRRDSDGFCRASGSWSHCMVFIGWRGGSRPGLLCLNSWGPNWVSGPKWPSDQPDGSFWVDARTANRMLSGRDSYAVSSLVGFPRQELYLVKGL